jgi:hypothetical protein
MPTVKELVEHQDKENKKVMNVCPECDNGKMVDGVCDKCGYKVKKKSKDKTKNDKSFREDFIDLLPIPETMEEEQMMIDFGDRPCKFQMTDEGFLQGRAVVTNIGVFPYRMPDGSMRFELRLPEEIFKKESLSTLKMKAVTNEHPKELVTADNARKVTVGTIGEDIRHDAYNIMAPICIQDKQTIDDIKSGKRSLSCGYTADVEEVSGVWNGVAYDAVQRNIIYNHVAIVDRGRAGDAAVIKMDSKDTPIGVYKYESKKQDNLPRRDHMSLKKINLDGVEYEAEAKVLETLSQTKVSLDSVNEELSALKADKSSLEADRDTIKEKLDNAEKEIEKLKKISPEKIDEAVATKIQLLDSAKKAEVEVKKDMTDTDIKKAVILSVFPGAGEKLDNADEVYVNARFDSAVELITEKLNKEAENKKDNADNLNKTIPTSDSGVEEKYDSEAAYKRYVADLTGNK